MAILRLPRTAVGIQGSWSCKRSRCIVARASEDPMRIVFVSMECAPWSKTGGLGDVIGALPIALSERGHHVMSVAPMYDRYEDVYDTEVRAELSWYGHEGPQTIVEGPEDPDREEVRYFYVKKQGVHRVFVDHPCFSTKALPNPGNPKGLIKDKIYGYSPSVEYPDNDLRMSLLCQAAIEATRTLAVDMDTKAPFGERVVFVGNDWHTAPLPLRLHHIHQPRGEFPRSRVAFCLHNAAYQGRYPMDRFSRLNLPSSALPSLEWKSKLAGEQAETQLNWLQAAFLESDLLLTVSKGYANEVIEGPHKGYELDGVLRALGGLLGIVNGMDTTIWNPSVDSFLEEDDRYTINTVNEGKVRNKEKLQLELGLATNPSVPLLAFIGRLDMQKGVDLLLDAISSIIESNDEAQFVLLGSGNDDLEGRLKKLEHLYPGRAVGLAQFSARLAHKINAAADYMLVPSRFEPCGLVQMHAMAYGTIPIVAPTGGLLDTVSEDLGYRIQLSQPTIKQNRPDIVNTGTYGQVEDLEAVEKSALGGLSEKMGLPSPRADPPHHGIEEINASAVADAILLALMEYHSQRFYEMRQEGMSVDWSWNVPAQKWEQALYTLWKI